MLHSGWHFLEILHCDLRVLFLLGLAGMMPILLLLLLLNRVTVSVWAAACMILPIGLSQVYTGTVGNVSLPRNLQEKLKKPISFSFTRTVTGVYYIMSYSLHDEP